MIDPKNLETWLHEKAGPAHDALKADPGSERLRILDAGLVSRLFLGRRLPGRDHLLGLAQPLAGFRQGDAPNTVAAESDGLLPAVD